MPFQKASYSKTRNSLRQVVLVLAQVESGHEKPGGFWPPGVVFWVAKDLNR